MVSMPGHWPEIKFLAESYAKSTEELVNEVLQCQKPSISEYTAFLLLVVAPPPPADASLVNGTHFLDDEFFVTHSRFA